MVQGGGGFTCQSQEDFRERFSSYVIKLYGVVLLRRLVACPVAPACRR